jgi:anaerobic ribonucleoside-triphosphate reductase activating protein
MYISGILEDSVVDGEGVRLTIFISGCNHNCTNCHNKETHSFTYGTEYNDKIKDKIFQKMYDLYSGITLSGGDPMYSAKELIPFVKEFISKFPNKNIWLYTGFTWEEIIKDKDMLELAKLCDIIVDGLYDESLKDYTGLFRGSTNQRFILSKESISKNSIINYEFTL